MNVAGKDLRRLLRALTLSAALLVTVASTQGATPTPAAPAHSAVYISAGDGISWGCCAAARSQTAEALFAHYLSDRLKRPVTWISIPGAGWVTTDTFLNGSLGQRSSIDNLADALAMYRHEGRPVVAITLSVGGNNLVDMGRSCAAPPCTNLYNQVLASMTPQLDAIYARINAAKDGRTPLLVSTYYNASDCGQADVGTSPAELGVRGWNNAITSATKRAGAFGVDLYTPFQGRACTLVHGIDLNTQGNAVLAAQYETAYASLPASYVDPYVATGTSWWVVAVVAGVIGLAVLGGIGFWRRRAAHDVHPSRQ